MAQQSRHKKETDQSRSVAKITPEPISTKIPAEVWVPVLPAANKGNRWPATGKLLIGGFFFLFISAFLVVIAIFGLLFFYSDLIFPGVRVLGVEVGSMTKSEAEAVLSQKWEQQTVLLTHDEGVWPVGGTDLGLVLDAQATAQGAYEQGRSAASWRRLLMNGAQFQPVWSFNPEIAREFLENFAPQIGVQPVDAGMQVLQGDVVETLPVDGRALDLEMTMRQLQGNPAKVLSDGRLPLITHQVVPDITDVSHLAQEARRLLSTTVSVHAYDPIRDETLEWAISPQQWGSWMTLALSSEEENGFEWVVDEDAAQDFLTAQLPALGDDRFLDTGTLIPDLVQTISTQQPGSEARIYHYPRRHIVQSGETLSSIGRDYGIPYPWIQQANPGSEFLRAGDEIVVPSSDEMLPLPVVENKRIVISISEQRTWVYEDGQVKWEWPASTGIDSSPTSPGIFQIQNHEPNAYASNWDLWMPNFMGIYRPLPTSDFMNGFHGFPTRNGSTLLWTGDLGHQVTYGCVLLSSENAALLYEWAEEGVVVEVKP